MSIDVNVQNDLVIVTESSEDITVNVSNAAGPAGANGVGVPVGGTTGQVLKKLSNTNYDTYWALDGGGVPYSGATGQVDLGNYDLKVQGLTIGKGNNSLVNNTALGHSTLLTITTGNFNTAVGYEALRNTTTGQYNTAVGQSSLFSNTTGGQNTALGLNALLLNTTGSTNVAVGLDALQHNTTGSSNTAIGYNAGSHITGGSTPNTTATNSVFIGRDSKAGADGQTNQIVIGQNAVGNGSNTATFGNTSTTANYFTGSINGGSFVKSGGTSSQFLKADGSVDSTTYVGGSGATGQVAYWNGTNSQTGSNNLFWDAANSRLGIGTNTPESPLHLNADMPSVSGLTITRTGVTLADANFQITNGTSTAGQFLPSFTLTSNFSSGGSTIGGFFSARITNSNTQDIGLIFDARTKSASALTQGYIVSFRSFSTDYIRIAHTGNLILQNGGTFTDSGQRLQNQGATLLNGATTINGEIQIDSAFRKIFAGAARTDTSRTSTGTSTIFYNALQLTANNAAWSFNSDTIYTLTSGNINGVFVKNTFAPTSGTATFSNEINQTIFQTGGANGTTRGLYVNPTLTAAADWRSIEWSNNSGWGLYGAGTANNYLRGNLGISNLLNTWAIEYRVLQIGNGASVQGQSNAFSVVHLSGNTYFDNTYTYRYIGNEAAQRYRGFNGAHEWYTAPAGTAGNAITFNQAMTLTQAGRLLLGTTTESTFLLDVNGTARVSGNVQFSDCVNYNDTIKSLNIVNNSTVYPSRGISVSQHSDPKGGAAFNFNRSRGTFASQTNVVDGDLVGFFVFNARVSGAYTSDRAYVGSSMTSSTGVSVFITSGSTDSNYAPTILAHHSGYVGIGLGGSVIGAVTVPTAQLDLAESTTARASLRIRSGVAPTLPNNGDIWFDGTDLKMRIGGVTKTFTLV